MPLVLLHGWGFDHHIWDDLLPALRASGDVQALDLPGFAPDDKPVADLQEAADSLLANLPPRSVLLGWSLGGMLATHLAIRYPDRVAGLITMGSNLKWVSDGSWSGAAPDNFAAFFENLVQDFEGTQRHFCNVVARGDRDEKTQSRLLRSKLAGVPQENFLAGLRMLDSIDNRHGYARLKMPGLHMFGANDVLVPFAVAERMNELNRRHTTVVIPGAAHAPFLSEAGMVTDAITRFLHTLPYRLDKKQIATSFSRAAGNYDHAAHMQRGMADQLLATVQAGQPAVILDAGCGTGHGSVQLRQRFPQAQVVSLDIASGMLREASSRHPELVAVCADAEQLPLPDASVDLIYSNAAIQWCQDHAVLFAEWQRVLKPGGTCVVSTFVEGTLQELRDAWLAVDDSVHVNRFEPARVLLDAAAAAGLCCTSWQQIRQERYYGSVSGLMRELKSIGVHNVNAGRRAGLLGKRQWLQLARAYEPNRRNGQLPARYEIAIMNFNKEP